VVQVGQSCMAEKQLLMMTLCESLVASSATVQAAAVLTVAVQLAMSGWLVALLLETETLVQQPAAACPSTTETKLSPEEYSLLSPATSAWHYPWQRVQKQAECESVAWQC